MAVKKIKVFSFNWDEGGWGGGIMLVAATTQEEAIECAQKHSKYWTDCSENTTLKYIGKYTEPIVILSSYYQE